MAFSILPTVISGDTYEKTAHYDPTRASFIACAHAVFPLGGSRTFVITAGGGAQDATDYIEFVYKVVVEVKTENAATTVTPRLYNVTDASVNWTGSAGTSTAWGTYQVSSALTIAAGKKYRLQFTKSDDVYESWGTGHIRRTAA
jgi:hypothetical protein